MATNLPDGGGIAENPQAARDCGLASVVIGGFIIVAVGIGFLLNWQTFLHARNMMSPVDIQLSAGVTAVLIALLVWVAVTGLRLSGRAGVGLSQAGRTLNVVALIYLGFLALGAAAIYHSVWERLDRRRFAVGDVPLGQPELQSRALVRRSDCGHNGGIGFAGIPNR